MFTIACLYSSVDFSICSAFMDKPFLEFLKSQKLSPKLQSLVAHALCYFDPDMNGKLKSFPTYFLGRL
jgi:hypothetical protein